MAFAFLCLLVFSWTVDIKSASFSVSLQEVKKQVNIPDIWLAAENMFYTELNGPVRSVSEDSDRASLTCSWRGEGRLPHSTMEKECRCEWDEMRENEGKPVSAKTSLLSHLGGWNYLLLQLEGTLRLSGPTSSFYRWGHWEPETKVWLLSGWVGARIWASTPHFMPFPLHLETVV